MKNPNGHHWCPSTIIFYWIKIWIFRTLLPFLIRCPAHQITYWKIIFLHHFLFRIRPFCEKWIILICNSPYENRRRDGQPWRVVVSIQGSRSSMRPLVPLAVRHLNSTKLMHCWGFALREGVFAETKEGKCRNKRKKASFKEFKKSAS